MTAENAKIKQINGVDRALAELRALAPDGFAIGLHITFSTPSFMFQTYPADWMTHYTQNGLVLQDPTVLWGFANQGRVDWADLEDTSPAGVMQQAADYGLIHGITVAFEEGDSLTIASFASKTRAFTKDEGAALESLVRALHKITASEQDLSAETVQALRALSIKLTH